MKSIIQDDNNCYIHMMYLNVEVPGTETHHCIHGVANRRLADADGLKVMLCHNCHMLLHDKGYTDKQLEQIAQKAWMETYGKSKEDFIKRYGKSYL